MSIDAATIESNEEQVTANPAQNTEANLISEVGSLWRVHCSASASLNKSRAELKALRRDLATKLYELKSVLSRPGRAGAWSSYLQSERMPRSTADRLVRAHEKAVVRERGNCTTEQITEPAEVVARRYLQGLWPKLSRVLTTPDAVEVFVAELWNRAQAAFAAVSGTTSEC
jgi:hypothetical protein